MSGSPLRNVAPSGERGSVVDRIFGAG